MELGGICSSPLWNKTISWDTKDPYLTACFKHLILVIGSCAVLWLVAPFEFFKISRYQGHPHPWTKISIAKIVCKAILLVICIIELAKETYAYVTRLNTGLDGLITSVAYFVTILLTVILTLMCRKRGLRSSVALPSFWMISTVSTVITIFDDIHAFDLNNWISLVSLIDDCLTFVISLFQLILSNIVEHGTSTYGRQLMDNCPLDEASFFSRLTFSWIFKTLVESTKKSLYHEDLIPLCSDLKSTNVARGFWELWNKNNKKNSSPSLETNAQSDLLYSQVSERPASFKQKSGKSLLIVLFRIAAPYIMLSFIFEIFYTALYFLPVYTLSFILNDIKEPEWHKYVFSVALFVALLFSTLVDSQRKYYGLVSAFKIKAAVMNAVFEKALVSQHIQNVEVHLQENTENIFQMTSLLSEVWGAPLRISIGLYILWLVLGLSSFAGVGTAVVLIFIAVLIRHIAGNFQIKALKIKSVWMNFFSECLHEIRNVKLNVLENHFLQKMKSLRKLEVSKKKISLSLRILHRLIVFSSASLVLLATFFAFVLMGNSFNLKKIFLAFATVHFLKSPFTRILPLSLLFVRGLRCIFKIQSYLEAKEIQSSFVPDTDSNCEVRLENAFFTWNTRKAFQLRNLNFSIEEGSLIAIVGEPLSGKSSLLRALMGEMELLNGSARIKGEIALVPDKSWIQNTTVEENILFERLKVDSIYNIIIKACELQYDIENLPQGEETEVGEKGFLLSASQKLKVDLARAMYQNADIYLLDNPFEFISASEAKKLFQNVFGHGGFLQTKIRLFTTKEIEFLPLVDQIFFLKDGYVVEQGSYSNLVQNNGYFADYVKSKKKTSSPRKESDDKSIILKSRNELKFDNFICQNDPWHSFFGLSLKAEPDTFMRGEIRTAPKAFLKKLANYFKTIGYLFLIPSMLMAFIATSCEVASLVWLTWRISDFKNKRDMYMDLYIYAGIIMAQVMFTVIFGIILCCGNTSSLKALCNWLLNRIMRAPLGIFTTNFVKRVLLSFVKDLRLSDEEIPMEIFMWLVTLMKVPAILAVTFMSSSLLIIFFMPFLIIFFILQKLYRNAWRQLHHLSASTLCPLFSLLENVFQGISNIRTSKTSISFVSRFHTYQDNFNKCHFSFLLVSRWLSSSIQIIGSFFVLFPALILINEKGVENHLTGLSIVLAMLIPEALMSFSCLSSALDMDLGCLERFQSFSSVKQEAEWKNQSFLLWPTSGSISIRNLNATSGDGLYPALNNVNITIKSGEKVAIIGKENSGITTILDSIFRVREISDGEIYIDNVDICSIGLHDLRSKIAFISQDPLVFKGTLRENLDPDHKCSDEELLLVIKTVGLEYNIGELRSIITNLSDEDKYRIALARGKLKKSKIVIVEGSENSSVVDKHFQSSTSILFGNSPVFENYDRIIHISTGEVEKGETSNHL